MFHKSYSGELAIAARQSVKEREYWMDNLSGELEKSIFPYDNKELDYKEGDKDHVDVQLREELFSRLTWISNNSDTRLLAVLAAGLIALLNKYTDSRDIIVGMPIYKQEIEENFLNTVVALRCSLQEDMTFKDLLYRVKQTIDEAVKHQNYPIKTILYDLQFPFSENDFSLFDIILLLKNIQNPDYIRNIPVNIKFIFFRGLECIEISVLYNRFLYDRETVARIISHFSHLLQKAILNVDLKLSALEILSDEEKKKILEEFNNMQAGLKEHTGKTIHRLFEEQVEKTPDREAIVFIQQGQVPTILTYRQLDKKAQQVARTLNEKGIVAGHIVALLLEGSTHMAVAVLGVLKAGGAYLPIDIEAPGERKTFILKDSGVRLLLTGGAGEREADSTLFSSLKSIEQLDISHENISRHHTSRQPGDEIYRSDPGFQSNPSAPSDPAYIIYTSGSTGRPKGVIVEHRQPVNTLVCRKVEYLMGPGHTALQLFSYAFDGFITGFFTPIISGARVILLSKDTIQDISQIVDIIILFKVTHFISIPVLFQAILSGMTEEGAASLQVITLAGDKVQPKLLEMAAEKNKKMEIVNEYGVTEAAVMSTIYRHQERDRRVKIGRPIGNTLIYITKGSHGQYLAPINVFGEMCIAGTGVARGYLNNPQLTSEKFINFHHSKVFCTGDLARWLPDGNIEFSGRMDFQVKVRGFRIELGEIEKQLLTLKHIKECIVTAFQNDEGEKYLCAFIVSSQQFSISGLREHLGRRLPEYMIPAFFIFLEKMPLSPNGKVDRKQLPVPAVAPKVGEYEPPRDRLESQLLQIWADILRLDKDTVGIDANFFQLGGHSLTATLMSNRIYKDLNVKIPMLEIFKAPQVRHLAEYIRASSEERYNAILPAEKKVYYAVSSAQLRLYILQHMDPDAIVYNIPIMNRLDGELYKEKLEYTFRQLIVRHEPLRTSFALVDGHPVQVIHEPGDVEFNIEYYTVQEDEHLRETVAGIFQTFVRPFDMLSAPLLRAALITVTSQQHILLVDIHHILTDIVAFSIVINNFLAIYNGRELDPLKIQYKDYTEWQHSEEGKTIIAAQERYWLQEFSGEIPVLNLPSDYPRPAQQNFAGNVITFQLNWEETAALEGLVRSEGLTLFMVVLGLFNIFLAKIVDSEEIVIGAAVVGRKHADLEQVFGIFLNMLALKNWPEKGSTIRNFFNDLKERTLAAFENQDYPYETLVEKVAVERDISRNPLFDAALMYQKQVDDPIETKANHMQGLNVSPYPAEKKIARYDLTLGVMESAESGRLVFQLEYSTSLFREETILRFSDYLRNVINSITRDLDLKIMQVEILSESERQQLIIDFNDTTQEYPRDKTIHQLIAEQVERTPDNDAIIFENRRLTYKELDNAAIEIAHYLSAEMHIQCGDRVGILMDRSVHIISAMLGILKAGGAYVAVDAALPEARIINIANDAGIAVFISETKHNDLLKKIPISSLYLDRSGSTAGLTAQLTTVQPNDLAYVAYTSGTTGAPKGIMIEHISVVNFITGITAFIDFGREDTILSLTTISFDIFGLESLLPLTCGARTVIGNSVEQLDNMALTAAIIQHNVSILQVTPSRLQLILSDDTAASKLAVLKYLLVGGETFPAMLLTKAREVVTGKIFNLYGPTETTIWSTAKEVSQKQSLNIGRPIANTKIYILDSRRQFIPTGSIGELYICGDGLARGYINNVELTAEKFSAAPFIPIPGIKVYRTGDLTRWLPSGNVEFLGRLDTQVKIRGFRIEPVEIANQLVKVHGIKEAVVIDCQDTSGETYLCAYLVREDGIDELKNSEIKNILSNSLPHYMIPSYYIWIERLPLSGNGKLIRSALPEPDMIMDEAYVPPSSQLERKLVDMWANVLNIDKQIISVISNFFELGGHSLKATILVAKIHKELNAKILLAAVFQKPTISELAEYIEGNKKESYTSLEPVEDKEYYALSPAQKRLYILQQMVKDSTVYNLPNVIPLGNHIEKEKLESVFKKLIKRHESLRTNFIIVADEPVQKINKTVDFSIHCSKVSEVDVESNIGNYIQPFDLSKAPLLRVDILTVSPAQQILLMDMHHIITDGVSHTILRKEFADLYSGKELPPLRLQYKDFAEWQNSDRQKQLIKEQGQYWLEMFADEVPTLNLPTDFPRPIIQNFAGNRVNFLLSVEENQVLKKIVKQTGTTLYMCILSLFVILLSRLSGQEDIVIGMPIAARKHADLEKIIGMFVNTLAIRSTPGGGQSYNEFLLEIKECTLRAYENQEYQFEELVDKLSLARDPGRNPLFDAAFNLLYMEENKDYIPKPQKQEQSIYNHRKSTSKFDLTLIAVELKENLVFAIEYYTQLFKPETIDRFISYFKILVNCLLDDCSKKLSELAIITEAEKHRILFEFNDTEAEYPKDKTIHALIAEQVEQTPDHMAIVGSDLSQLTYGELNERSGRISSWLLEKGVRTDTIIAIMMERSLELITGILGILKAGSAYLPIDPKNPQERIDFMLKDSRAGILLTHDVQVGPDPGLKNMESSIPSLSSQLAYIIYTSGTTGRPKGIMIEHRSLVNLCFWHNSYYQVTEKDHASQYTSFSFDASVWEVFPYLIKGAVLYIINDDFKTDIQFMGYYYERHCISISFLPTQFCRQFIEEWNQIRTLRVLLTGGEKLDRAKETAYRFYNNYGPTENTVVTTSYLVEVRQEDIPIGKPIAKSIVSVVDKYNNLQVVGVPGELCIGGEGLARGYLNRPELTSEKFVISPFTTSHLPLTLFYKTGDLVRWLPDGNIEFLGRIDHQVKIRGFRVELGEIEKRLAMHPGIKEAVTTCRLDDKGDKYLCSYIIPKKELDISELQEYLAKTLPYYMIPSYFVQMEKIPLTPNGKLDRKALPGPKLEIDKEYEAPRDKVEEKLVDIWAEVLGIEKEIPGINSNFFELGGHSLRATILVSKIKRNFNVNIPLIEIFKTPTIKAIASLIKVIHRRDNKEKIDYDQKMEEITI